MKSKRFIAMVALASVTLFARGGWAVEGGIGRPVSGALVTPYIGLIPPAPGPAIGIGEIYYSGSIGGNIGTPIAGDLALQVDAKVSFTPVTLSYIWNTPETPKWNFASAINFPITFVETTATVSLGNRLARQRDSIFGLFDIAIVPLIASYHASKTDHLAFTFTMWVPSGSYVNGRLANLGLNNWTFIPSVAYTKIFPEANVEFSTIWAVQFYTENPATHYQNGVGSDLELLTIKRFKNGFGFGVVGSWITQFNGDSGALADRLNGFKGRAVGLGPIATYSTEIGKHHLDFNIRFVREFDVKKRLEGNLFSMAATFKF